MRAVMIERFGGPGVLQVVSVDEPMPGPGEVLIRTVASAINPVDDKTRAGGIGDAAPPVPMMLGWELAGVVVRADGDEFAPGDRVFAMSHQLSTGRGTWSDLVVLSARDIALAPMSLGLVEAATLPLPGLTAWQTLTWLAPAPGHRVLVTGAAGAVGGIAVQIASSRGLSVDALVSRPAQIDVVRSFGAAGVYTSLDEVPNSGYHAVFDTFGADAADKVMDNGSYASIATQAGPVPDLSERGVRSELCQVHPDGRDLRELARLVDEGAVSARLDSIFPLKEIRSAHHRFHEGRLNGKVALVF